MPLDVERSIVLLLPEITAVLKLTNPADRGNSVVNPRVIERNILRTFKETADIA